MRKIFTLLSVSGILFSTNLYADYVTSGLKNVYTLSSLSEIQESGVTKAENVFTVSASIEISVGDTLRLENNATVLLADGVNIYVKGYGDFTPADTALITRLNEEAKPKGLYFNDDEAAGQLKNVTIEYAGVRYNGKKDMLIENCTFRFVGTSHTSSGAVAVGDGGKTTIRYCNFISNESSAIGMGANQQHGITFTDNYLYDNNTKNSNRPQINITSSGEELHTIARNTVIGTQRTKVGGIAIANLLGMSGANKAIVEDNYVTQCRYGLTFMGPLDLIIRNNRLVDNKYEPDPNNGGSGISIYDSSSKLTAVITNNHIEKHLWGITLLGGKEINIGKLNPESADYNPGQNVFIDNGNNDVLYDLYNNTALTIYAQGNTWNVDEQTPEKIETVIFHKNDNPQLGEVIYQFNAAGLSNTQAIIPVYYDMQSRKLKASESMQRVKVFDLNGVCLLDSGEGAVFDEYQLPAEISGFCILEIVYKKGSVGLKIRL